jgi:DNA polymerase-1
MRARIAPIREGVQATGVASLSVEQYEGDDCVASVMTRFRDHAHITLLSNDSDLLQFVSEGVAVATYVGVGKGQDGERIKRWTAADVQARFGVLPEQLPAFKALCGEEGDDIPGVKSVGKGTAVKLLRRWQSLEKALEASEFVSHRDDTAKLAGQHEHLRLMLQLTTIRTDAPVPVLGLSQCAIGAVTWPSGSAARMATSAGGSATGSATNGITRMAAGPGLEAVPFPEEY